MLARILGQVPQLIRIGSPVVEFVDIVGMVDVGIVVRREQAHAVETHVAAVKLAVGLRRPVVVRRLAPQHRHQ